MPHNDARLPKAPAIVLFDGECVMCSFIVRFVYARDPQARLRFAPLQSDAGQMLLQRHGLSTDRFDTFVLVEGDRCYTKSTAALRLARRLRGLWPLCCAFVVVPRPLRDAVYGFVAKNRYRWFGRSDACMMPTPELKRRFVEPQDLLG
ncbi:thiol-disulfide oxidoreductase DCC family protein [Paenibacillus chartarius]|uniref:Thiol-disulfide oxidoreductase DCC family protein n=1 Tax=Paenibacillus chartarius TaxID=747481 RepID=A0ABV6DL27_9BACL